MIVLALDIATRTGFAHDNPAGGPPLGGVLRIPSPLPIYSKDGGATSWEYGACYKTFHVDLSKLVASVRPEIGVFEAPINIIAGKDGKRKVQTSQTTIRLLFALAGIAELVFAQHDIPISETNITTVKKHFAGHGHAEKPAMLARCRQLGWDCNGDHNTADAMAIWSLAKSLLDPKWRPGLGTPLFGRDLV